MRKEMLLLSDRIRHRQDGAVGAAGLCEGKTKKKKTKTLQETNGLNRHYATSGSLLNNFVLTFLSRVNWVEAAERAGPKEGASAIYDT